MMRWAVNFGQQPFAFQPCEEEQEEGGREDNLPIRRRNRSKVSIAASRSRGGRKRRKKQQQQPSQEARKKWTRRSQWIETTRARSELRFVLLRMPFSSPLFFDVFVMSRVPVHARLCFSLFHYFLIFSFLSFPFPLPVLSFAVVSFSFVIH